MLSAHLKLIDTRESYVFGHPSMKWPDTKFPLLFGVYTAGSIRHYFPSPGRQTKDRAGARHGNFTPPRISPSCPHCLWLWLDRSIMIG